MVIWPTIRLFLILIYAFVTLGLYLSTMINRKRNLITRKEALQRYLVCLVLFGVPAIVAYAATLCEKYL